MEKPFLPYYPPAYLFLRRDEALQAVSNVLALSDLPKSKSGALALLQGLLDAEYTVAGHDPGFKMVTTVAIPEGWRLLMANLNAFAGREYEPELVESLRQALKHKVVQIRKMLANYSFSEKVDKDLNNLIAAYKNIFAAIVGAELIEG